MDNEFMESGTCPLGRWDGLKPVGIFPPSPTMLPPCRWATLSLKWPCKGHYWYCGCEGADAHDLVVNGHHCAQCAFKEPI